MNFFRFLVDVFFGPLRYRKRKAHRAHSLQHKHFYRMRNLIHNIRHTTHAAMQDLEKFEQGNKTAGKRVRKYSIELEKLYKEFRKRSVSETPKAE